MSRQPHAPIPAPPTPPAKHLATKKRQKAKRSRPTSAFESDGEHGDDYPEPLAIWQRVSRRQANGLPDVPVPASLTPKTTPGHAQSKPQQAKKRKVRKRPSQVEKPRMTPSNPPSHVLPENKATPTTSDVVTRDPHDVTEETKENGEIKSDETKESGDPMAFFGDQNSWWKSILGLSPPGHHPSPSATKAYNDTYTAAKDSEEKDSEEKGDEELFQLFTLVSKPDFIHAFKGVKALGFTSSSSAAQREAACTIFKDLRDQTVAALVGMVDGSMKKTLEEFA